MKIGVDIKGLGWYYSLVRNTYTDGHRLGLWGYIMTYSEIVAFAVRTGSVEIGNQVAGYLSDLSKEYQGFRQRDFSAVCPNWVGHQVLPEIIPADPAMDAELTARWKAECEWLDEQEREWDAYYHELKEREADKIRFADLEEDERLEALHS